MTILYLVCANEEEADKITEALLDKKLIACAKKIETKSTFRWQGKINRAEEVLLLLETKSDLFEKIESEVQKLHSHKTFVLAEIPIGKTSNGVSEWINEELGH